MQEKNLSRREREKLMQRQEMLAAAIELFSEKGYHNVSMQEIAGKAEFAVGTLYKFFRNKEDLYSALLVELADKFHDALIYAIEEADDEIEKLRNYVKIHGKIFMENAPSIRLYFAETRGASFNVRACLDKEIQEQYEQFIYMVASVFESGMKKRLFRKIAEPHQLAIALDSICNSFLFNWLQAPELHPSPEDPDTILNILFKGLIEE